jgi:hypothetical protein
MKRLASRLTWWHRLPHKSTPRSRPQRVGVEMMVAHNPLHRSQRAGLPHWALTSGNDAKAPEGIGVTNARRGQPAVEQPLHPLPGDTARVTAPRERTLPEPRHLVAKHVQRRAVHGHPVIADVPTNDQTQPPAHLRDRVVQAPPEFGFHLAQLRLHPLPARLPNHREPPIPLLPADVREAEEIERLRLPLPDAPPALGRVRTELQQPRLLGVQRQTKPRKPLAQLGQEPLGLHKSERDEERWWIAELLRIKAELIVLAEGADAAPTAEAHLQDALAWTRRQDALSLELRCATALARLWQKQGRAAPARDLLAPIYARFTERFATADLEAAKALLESARIA